ncbi:hypothetical protein QU38_00655, partial [Staphylococcus aureus]
PGLRQRQVAGVDHRHAGLAAGAAQIDHHFRHRVRALDLAADARLHVVDQESQRPRGADVLEGAEHRQSVDARQGGPPVIARYTSSARPAFNDGGPAVRFSTRSGERARSRAEPQPPASDDGLRRTRTRPSRSG